MAAKLILTSAETREGVIKSVNSLIFFTVLLSRDVLQTQRVEHTNTTRRFYSINEKNIILVSKVIEDHHQVEYNHFK